MIIKVIGKSVIYSRNGRNSWMNIICQIVSGIDIENSDLAYQFVVDRDLGEQVEYGKNYRLKSGFTAVNGKIDSKIIDMVEVV